MSSTNFTDIANAPELLKSEGFTETFAQLAAYNAQFAQSNALIPPLQVRATNLETRTTSVENRETSVEARTTALETAIANLTANLTATQNALTTATGRITAIENRKIVAGLATITLPALNINVQQDCYVAYLDTLGTVNYTSQVFITQVSSPLMIGSLIVSDPAFEKGTNYLKARVKNTGTTVLAGTFVLVVIAQRNG